MSAFTEMQLIDPPFASFPCTAQQFLLSQPLGITTGTQIWAPREDLDPSPPVFPPPAPHLPFWHGSNGEGERHFYCTHSSVYPFLSICFS